MKRLTSFQLMGRSFQIKYVKNMPNMTDCSGICEFDNNTISIQHGLAKDLEAHTLWHEITHSILYAMNEEELNKNEKFIDVFSGLLHQVLKTIE